MDQKSEINLLILRFAQRYRLALYCSLLILVLMFTVRTLVSAFVTHDGIRLFVLCHDEQSSRGHASIFLLNVELVATL